MNTQPKKTRFAIAAGLLMTGFALPICGNTQPLEGTTWRLVSIQSMDDAKGTTKVADPSLFTLEFGRDGRASLRLDCNRGTGTYKAEPAGDGSTGTITFGPIAGTRALCPPPHLDERVIRDLAYVRGYRFKDGRLYLSLMADGGIYEWATVPVATEAKPDPDRRVQSVLFARGKSATLIRGRVSGHQYIDYTVKAAAGQRMKVSLKGSNGANYFNVLPPDSADAAMALGDLLDNRFDGLLPDDGTYTVRVFLVRAAARRNESSDFSLSIGVTGAPLKPRSQKVDAVLPNSRYHARTSVTCEPAQAKTRECEAWVVRRGFDGSATVELRWEGNSRRRILFVKGEPKAADTFQAMTASRTERGWKVEFANGDRFDIPEELVNGG